MTVKTAIPKGTRDFTPIETARRAYIFDTIKSVFKMYGYQPIETPAMENLDTLTGKYGEEGDRLIFKILNSGDFTAKIEDSEFVKSNYQHLTPRICEKALRYDLTVPFARFVVQHQNEILFPFKRYQIQPVWRADKPQKGRYREFYQCDVDVIGSNALLNEAELAQIINDVFEKLRIPVILRINNRKILAGIAEIIGEPENFMAITVALDKLDKIGIDNVIAELKEKGIKDKSIEKLKYFTDLAAESNKTKLSLLKELLKGSIIGEKGLEEINELFAFLNKVRLSSEFSLDITLARGLNYYTGTIFEVIAKDIAMGSICGGGRYDDLTGIFGLNDLSGVGVSFGADRIYDVLNEKALFPKQLETTSKVLFMNFGNAEALFCFGLANELRKEGIASEIYPDAVKIKKQMNYADKKQIPYVAIVGESEIQQQVITLKNMLSGEQKQIKLLDFVETVKHL